MKALRRLKLDLQYLMGLHEWEEEAVGSYASASLVICLENSELMYQMWVEFTKNGIGQELIDCFDIRSDGTLKMIEAQHVLAKNLIREDILHIS